MATTTTSPKTIDVREAANKAADYFKQLYPSQPLRSLSLEEVELSEDGKSWLITLGYEFEEDSDSTTGARLLIGRLSRTQYKIFKVDAKTGRVLAMKIRKLE